MGEAILVISSYRISIIDNFMIIVIMNYHKTFPNIIFSVSTLNKSKFYSL